MHVCVALMRECVLFFSFFSFFFLVFLSPTIFLLDSGMCACVLHLMSVRLYIDISKRAVIYFVKQSCIKNKTKKCLFASDLYLCGLGLMTPLF